MPGRQQTVGCLRVWGFRHVGIKAQNLESFPPVAQPTQANPYDNSAYNSGFRDAKHLP